MSSSSSNLKSKNLNLPPPPASILRGVSGSDAIPSIPSNPCTKRLSSEEVTLRRSSSSNSLHNKKRRSSKKKEKVNKPRTSSISDSNTKRELLETIETFKDIYLSKKSGKLSVETYLKNRNIRTIEKNIKTLKNEITLQNQNINQDSPYNLLYSSMNNIINVLSSTMSELKSSKNEEEIINSISQFSDLNTRINNICMNINDYKNTEIVLPREQNMLQLLKKLEKEDTSYINKLLHMQRYYREQLKEKITTREDTVLFSECNTLLELHKNILTDVRFLIENFPIIPIGKLFQHYIIQFTPYITYSSNVDEAKDLLQKLIKENKDFRQSLKSLEAKGNHLLMDLIEYPGRKIEQYLVYFEQFYHFTAPKSSDKHRLDQIIDDLQILLDKCGTKADIADQLQKLQLIGEEIDGLDENLIVPGRKLVYQGSIRFKPENGDKIGDYVYLFTDILIYVQKKSSRKLFLGKLGMHTIMVSDIANDYTSFKITNQSSPTSKKEEFTLTVDSEDEKMEWILQFNNVYRDVIRYRKVFGVPLKILCKRDESNIPQFIEKSISFIREYGLKSEGIFRLSGRASQIEKLRDQLDQGKKVFFSENMDVHSVANLFKQWLREMPEPILTWKLYDKFIEANRMENEQKIAKLQVLLHKKLPKENYESFKYMLKLLSEVIENREYTKLDAKNLAVVFAPNVLVNGDPDVNPFSLDFEAVNSIFREMLVHYDILFNESDLKDKKTDKSKKQNRTCIGNSNTLTKADTKIRNEQKKKRTRNTSSLRIQKSLAGLIKDSVPMSTTNLNVLEQKDTGIHSRKESYVEVATKAAETGKQKMGKEGYLMQYERQWKKYYFIVDGGYLKRYNSNTDRDKKYKIRYNLSSVLKISAISSFGEQNAMQLERKKDIITLAASTEEDMLEWVTALSYSKTVNK